MNTMQRITMTITAKMNSLIDQLEDHEAVSECILNEVAESMQGLRFQVRKIQSEIGEFRKQKERLIKEAGQWKARAVKIEPSDRVKAIECVRRMKASEREVEAYQQRIDEHEGLEVDLSARLAELERKFLDLKRKHSSLTARQTRADALESAAQISNEGHCDSIFSRWEKQILKSESREESAAVDHLSREMNEEEERENLELSLGIGRIIAILIPGAEYRCANLAADRCS